MYFISTVQKHATQRNWESEGKMSAHGGKTRRNNANLKGEGRRGGRGGGGGEGRGGELPDGPTRLSGFCDS